MRCSRCGNVRETPEYPTETLKALREANNLQEAVCLHCDPVHLPRDWETKRITCAVCLDELGFDKFSIPAQKMVAQKQHYSAKCGARCLDCQYPQCSHCGKKMEAPLNTHDAPKTKDCLLYTSDAADE